MSDNNAERDRVRAHVFVSGRVQGVFYRATTRDEARDRGVDGWVRNLDDGRVEAVFEGPKSAVDAKCASGAKPAVARPPSRESR